MNSTLQGIKRRFGIIGNADKLNRALSTAMRVSGTDLSVMISGESGVGKEVFSKIIHQMSPRKHNQFIAINTGAIPEGTINSELFGHEKGAFTGASAERKGYFETANGGTVFLDEIGEMPLDTQAFLLRILESGEYMKVGSSNVLKTDVRIIAATNISLEEQIKKGKFREDLYYRLNTVPIFVPSLKERREDIYPLYRRFAIDFAEKYSTEVIELDDKARLLFENYTWPGNVRELKNIVEQLSILTDEKEITAEQLLDLVPQITQRNLPSLSKGTSSSDIPQEREILYQLLFDMKKDLNDLKSLVFELIKSNDLRIPDMSRLNSLSAATPPAEVVYEPSYTAPSFDRDVISTARPVIINKEPEFQTTEVVEENLSLEEMEKEMIVKALKKYRGRRKDAAVELGISERTLYRKIKEYEL
jgi:transcriptional regulator with PAS, ATPase and Fis domain